ncbi:MAG: flagellar hook-length control protein FliK [Gallionella sp.]
MTNLPISINNPPPQAKGTSGDATLSRSDPAAPSGNSASQANSPAKDQGAEPFSALLKRQIGAGWETGLNGRKTAIAADGKAAEDAAAAAKIAQDQINSNAGIQSDQAGSLAAMMLQTPAQDRAQDNSAHSATKKSVNELRLENDALQSPGKPAGKGSVLPKTDDTTALARADVVKQAEMTAGFAAESHAMPSKEKMDTPGTATAGLPNMIGGNNTANTAQTVTAPIGSNSWAGEFSQKIVWISNQKIHSAELHMNPPDLGPLNVVMKMSDNQLTAQFTSQHSAVRDAIENALPKLRELLADNNIMLGNATVSDQAPRDRGGDGYSNQGSGSSAQRESTYNATESNQILPITTQSLPARRHNGMLDTFA